MTTENYYEMGREAAKMYYSNTSQAFKGYTQNVRAEDAIKLFLASPPESLIMVATPLPKSRQKWIAGFKKEQTIILAQKNISNCNINIHMEEYSWHTGTLKDKRLIIKYQDKEIGKAKSFCEAQKIQEDHFNLNKSK